jgi:TATA-binding protein-associated factor Taf7
MKLKILTFITILLLTFSAQADNDDPVPSCSQPDKPDKFTSQSQLDSFNSDVQQYQRCLYDFVDEQEEAIQRHQRAANAAIDEWNNFVRMELN